MKTKTCCECRSGEHENYDDNIKMVYVKDPDNGKIIRRGYMCGEHRQMFDDDGYTVIPC